MDKTEKICGVCGVTFTIAQFILCITFFVFTKNALSEYKTFRIT